MNRSSLISLISLIFCGLYSFSQNITIDGNGTVRCPSAPLGTSEVISGKTYYVVDRDAILSINNTGSFTVGSSTITPTDLSCVCTSQVSNMESLFYDNPTFNDDISNWDTSNVTNMYRLFAGASAFNRSLNSWDVSRVTNMMAMFDALVNGAWVASAFNQPLDNWDVSSVENMREMFRGAISFNQNINNWNVSSVTSMFRLFLNANSFDQPLNTWDVSNVTTMQGMFENTPFNQDISTWDVSNVTDMNSMFQRSAFNQNINNWDVSSVTNMYRMFRQSDFNQPLNNWDVSSVKNFSQMFFRNTNFNQNVNDWDLTAATNLDFMFDRCRIFNQPLDNWDTSNITSMRGVFRQANAFNQDISSWDVSKVTRMSEMFEEAFAFDQDISGWDVSSVNLMNSMFEGAVAFNSDISGWNTTSLENMASMFNGATAFSQNLNSWDVSSVTNMNNTFRNADAFNEPLDNWNTSSVEFLSGTFRANDLFNQDLSSWDTSSVINMRETFMSAVAFNNGQTAGTSNTLQWDTSDVTRMDDMFNNATAFNCNISSWNVSNVTSMARMFRSAGLFNQNISNWNTSSLTNLQEIFSNATIFNNGLSSGVSSTIMNWNTSNVLTIQGAFASASAFNGNISGWDVSNVTVAINAFFRASSFNQPIGGWNVTSISNMNNMFREASVFDSDISCWCVEHDPNRASFSLSAPIDLLPEFLPRWSLPCSPIVTLTNSFTNPNNLIGPGESITFTASFDRPISNVAQYTISGGTSYSDMSSIDSSTWIITLNANTLADNIYTFSINATDYCNSTYNVSKGQIDGNEIAVDNIQFTVDTTPPTLILTHHHPDNILIGNETVLITATFNEPVRSSPIFNLSGLITNTLMNATPDPKIWTYLLDISSLSIPINGGSYDISINGSDIAGNTYTSSTGLQNGNETGIDSITFSMDNTPPTVVLEDSDIDNIIYPTDSIVVTATFSEAMKSAPELNFSGSSSTTIIMSSTGSPSVWTFAFDFPSLSIPSGIYTLTVSGTDILGNPYSGTENIVLDYKLISPNLSIEDYNRNILDSNFDLTATTSSTGELTFSILNSSVATISGTSVSIVGVGSTIITVNQAASLNYNAGTATSVLTISKIIPSITASDVLIKKFGEPEFNLIATSSSTGNFSYQIVDNSIATFSGSNVVSITGVGTTTIIITQAEDTNYFTTSRTITLFVDKADPKIQNSQVINKIYNDPDFPVSEISAVSSSTGLFSFTVMDSSIAGIASNTIIISGAGTTTIIITQASDNFYNSGISSVTLIINKATPSIHFPNKTVTYGDQDFTIAATSSSTGDFIYTIDDTSIVTHISSSQGSTTSTASITSKNINNSRANSNPYLLSISNAGSTTISAFQQEDANYLSATATMLLTVLKKDETATWYSTSVITRTFGIPPFEVIRPNVASNYNGLINYSSSDPSIASFSSRDLTVKSVGTTTLFANIAADNNYNARTATVTLIVEKASQSIIVEPLPLVKPLKDFTSLTVSATSTSGAPVIITLSPGSAASLSGSIGNYLITNINQTGLVTITFTTDSNAHPNYKTATVTVVIDVVKSNQNISVTSPIYLDFQENLTYNIIGSTDSSLPLNYQIISGRADGLGLNASLSGNTLNIFDIGEWVVEVSQPGNNSFNPAISKTVVVNVVQGSTLLTNFDIPDKLIIDDDFPIPPPTSNRSGGFRYFSGAPNIAEIIINQISINGIGSSQITAIQDATPRFTSDSISTIFNVNDTDCDSDGIGDTVDEDDDNDNIFDVDEILNGTDPCEFDSDNDLIGDGNENIIGTNPLDSDTDDDGVIDGLDDFPLDPSEIIDSDNDGIGDNADDDDNNDGFLDDRVFVSGLVTPGVNGSEATWKIVNIENHPNSKVFIYDRNGLLVYEKSNYQNDWAGTYYQTGELLPAGSYYYIIIGIENSQKLDGWLYLTY